MMSTLVKTLHDEFKFKLEDLDNKLIKRELELPTDLDKATVAIGMRRTGKTYSLLIEIKRLLQEGVPIEQILYIDFEDDRLQPLSQEILIQLLDGFYSLYPENHKRLCYLVLDEIHVVPDWPLVIRRYLNTKKVKIYLTGSSAKLLSKEIATSLRGRSLSVEIWPFSFEEYLLMYNLKSYELPLSRRQVDEYNQLLQKYLIEGGLPEVINQKKIRWARLLRDYVDVVTMRDIIERHHITNIPLIKYMISFLIKNAASKFSINKFYQDLKSQGFSVGRETISHYLEYIEDAYLVFSITAYSESLRKSQSNPKKCYAIDTGMIQANQLSLSSNWGRLFENLIFLDLRRRGDIVYYYITQDRYEVDFFTKSLDGKLHLYQVAWDANDKQTLEREMRALHQAEQELHTKGQLITPATYLQWKASMDS